jgi:hypothetical protein
MGKPSKESASAAAEARLGKTNRSIDSNHWQPFIDELQKDLKTLKGEDLRAFQEYAKGMLAAHNLPVLSIDGVRDHKIEVTDDKGKPESIDKSGPVRERKPAEASNPRAKDDDQKIQVAIDASHNSILKMPRDVTLYALAGHLSKNAHGAFSTWDETIHLWQQNREKLGLEDLGKHGDRAAQIKFITENPPHLAGKAINFAGQPGSSDVTIAK